MNVAAFTDVDVYGSTRVDPIEEIRLRTWARQNYAPEDERQDDWHPVVLDEMCRKDREQDSALEA